MFENKLSLLAEKVIAGHMSAIAKAIRLAEDEPDQTDELLMYLYPYQGKAHRLGVAGPPGAGKSSFTNRLIEHFRTSGRTVGVVAVDPSSPFSGGAILGDRLRMNRFDDDPEVFIRSMATRGYGGGLSRAAVRAADIFDAAGKDVVILETVGVGQAELDIMTAADTVIVMTVPNAGDVVQNMKAGLMETGDILVVNKADLPGAEAVRDDIEFVLEERQINAGRRASVYLTNALKGDGIKEVFQAVAEHFQYLHKSGALKQRRLRRLKERTRFMVNDRLLKQFWTTERLTLLNEQSQKNENAISPYELAKKIIEPEK